MMGKMLSSWKATLQIGATAGELMAAPTLACVGDSD
jgi:hypothetical protein